MQEDFSNSVSESLTFSERREVTRNVESALLEVEVTIVNAGNIAFNISNLELTARVKDPIAVLTTGIPLAKAL